MERSLLEKKLPYSFQDPKLLEEALTHTSFSNEQRDKNVFAPSNERLEFLGDAVLQIAVSDYLFRHFPKENEGFLTQIRQRVVCESALARVARGLSLGDFLRLGKGEMAGNGKDRNSILANAMEAVFGALYLDCGGEMQKAQDIVVHIMSEEMEHCHPEFIRDYKTELQKFVQQDGIEQLEYELVSEYGPDHAKSFFVYAKLNSNIIGRGIGRSKREAEQRAAQEALSLFGIAKKR